MLKRFLICFGAFCLSGCVTMSGTYKVNGIRSDGTTVRPQFTAEGRHIYTARNAICAAYPDATVTIVDISTGEELTSESPYKCKGAR